MLQKRIDDQPSISRENIREAEGIFLQHLRRVGLKQTGQRSTILRTFLETREHLSTDELHRLVKKNDAHIGFTTVYRTLKLFADCGLASEARIPKSKKAIAAAMFERKSAARVRMKNTPQIRTLCQA